MKSEILRRTFEAAKYPKGSQEREKLNEDSVTGEYMTSYKYILRKPFLMSDGTLHPNQKFISRSFRTKAEAVVAQEQEERGEVAE